MWIYVAVEEEKLYDEEDRKYNLECFLALIMSLIGKSVHDVGLAG
jgi:hypothetical protein